MVQTDRHTSYTYAHTRKDLQTDRSSRGYLREGSADFVCVCMWKVRGVSEGL